MSFYRTILAAVAAIALASPVFADDAAQTAPAQSTDTSMQQSTDQSSDAMQQKVNINTATAKELMKTGMSAKQARAVIAYRKKNGDFKSVDDLANVKGFKVTKKMTQDMMDKMKAQMTIE